MLKGWSGADGSAFIQGYKLIGSHLMLSACSETLFVKNIFFHREAMKNRQNIILYTLWLVMRYVFTFLNINN